jgi:hypothetical protein
VRSDGQGCTTACTAEIRSLPRICPSVVELTRSDSSRKMQQLNQPAAAAVARKDPPELDLPHLFMLAGFDFKSQATCLESLPEDDYARGQKS